MKFFEFNDVPESQANPADQSTKEVLDVVPL